ncbi:phospho-acceptor domain-containing protein [Desulfobotulus alkaliphilus]|uniref:histidine kinase n=2 Tax=Desulfobotulus alkaliphilus TaxID=622671 RepID=A0A562S650_9BACT|nr:phospho-acceptor domain-containing protein [Desulfobotulus alkaliphilus]
MNSPHFFHSKTARILAETAARAGIGIVLIQDSPEITGEILYMNSHMKALCLHSGQEALAGKTIQEILLAGSEGRGLLLLPESGESIPVEVVHCPRPLEDTPVDIYYIRDISDQIQKEKQLIEYSHNLERMVEKSTRDLQNTLKNLKETQSQLIQSEKMASLGQLAAGVAHEINNPVGFVKSNLGTVRDYFKDIFELFDAFDSLEENLENGKNTAETREEIKKIRARIDLDFIREDHQAVITESLEGMERVARIVSDLKDFSHTGKMDAEVTDIHQCLESTLNIVWNEIKYKAEIIREFQPLPLVLCVPQKLSQVFMNILVNAAQAIEKQGTITLKTQIQNSFILVDITDSGKGIPEDILPKIFDPFFTTKPVGKGTGLGLNISYNIMHQLGGDISAHSTPGKGSTFSIRIPLREP